MIICPVAAPHQVRASSGRFVTVTNALVNAAGGFAIASTAAATSMQVIH